MRLDRSGYEVDFLDTFEGDELDRSRWIPAYLPQWGSRALSAARYEHREGKLRLLIESDQLPWSPEHNGRLRVSNLQTGVFAGPVGSEVGQHRFAAGLRVREAQDEQRLYTPLYGIVEARVSAIADPNCMVALWMIGFEDRPERSAEICIFEIFGKDVAPDTAIVGMGLHPFGDIRAAHSRAGSPCWSCRRARTRSSGRGRSRWPAVARRSSASSCTIRRASRLRTRGSTS